LLSDDVLRGFAERHGAELSLGLHGGEVWSITWEERALSKTIQVWVNETRNYNEVWMTSIAWLDQEGRDRMISFHPRSFVLRLPRGLSRLEETLEMVKRDADSLKEDDLKPAERPGQDRAPPA
jgi:hypothetical protein